jgi:multiple sugar transport system substrate-binding protein
MSFKKLKIYIFQFLMEDIKMKKNAFFVMCAVLMCALFVTIGCNKESGSSEDGITTIKVWTNNAHSKPEVTAAVDAFNAAQGKELGIFIDYTVYGGDYYTVLDLAISAGEEPHIYKITGKLPQLVQEQAILPLTELPQWFKDSTLKDYEPYHIDNQSRFGGVPYTINWAVTGYSAMAYNVPLLKEAGYDAPPTTWAEFEEMCVAVSKVRPGQTFGTYLPLKYANYTGTYVGGVMAPSYGKFWFDFTTGKYCFADFVEYFEMYQRLQRGGAMFPGIENLDDDTARAQFAEGNIAFILVNPSFNVGVLRDQFPAKMEWKVVRQPVKDPNNYYNVMGTTATNLVVSKKVKDEGLLEEVARVFAYMISDEVAGSLFTAGKDLPINPRVLENATPSDSPQWNATAEIAAGSVLRPYFPDSMFVVEGDLENASFAKIFVGGDAREILTDMDKRFNEAFERAVERGQIKREDYIQPNIEEQFKRK